MLPLIANLQVELRPEEANTHRLLDALRHGTLDVAFTHSTQGPKAGLNSEVVKEEPLGAVLPVLHPAAGGSAVRLADLASELFILKPFSVGPELHRQVIEACRRAGFEARLGREAPQIATIVSFVAAELGVALVPASMQQMPAPGVCYLPLSDVQASTTLSMMWRRGDPSKVVQNLVALVRSTGRTDKGAR